MKKHYDNSRRFTGFTLVEMLVVISILMLLIGVAIPAFTGVVKQVHKSQSQAIINQIDGAIRLFQTDHSSSPNSPGSDPTGLPNGSYTDTNGHVWYGCQAIVLYLTGYHNASGVYGANDSNAFGWRTSRNSQTYGPYNDTEKLKVTPGSAIGYSDSKNVVVPNYNNTGTDKTFADMIADRPNSGVMDAGEVSHPMFLDAFGSPILYFAANFFNPTTNAFAYRMSQYNNQVLDGNFCHDGIHNQDLFGNVYNNGVYYTREDGIDTGVQHLGPGNEITYNGVHSDLTPVFGPPPTSYCTNPATGAFYRSDFMLMSWGASQQYGGSVKDDTNNLYGK
jgi:type II secretory pathway pseudopilin PulG